MISSFKVEGFKSLFLPEPLDLGRVNIFIGSNGSGKSNFLEAIGVLGAAAFGSIEPETLKYRGVRLGTPTLYKTSLANSSRIRRTITIEASGAKAKYRVSLDNPIQKPSPKWGITNELLSENSHEIATRSPRGARIHGESGMAQRIAVQPDQTVAKLALTQRPDAVDATKLVADLADFAIFSPTTPVLRGVADEPSPRAPLGLNGGNLPQALKDVINVEKNTLGEFDLDDVWEMIDWAESVSAVPSTQVPLSPAVKSPPIAIRFVDRFMRKERNTLSAYDASEGALYVLFMLTLLSHPASPRVVAVDNFDHALHPRLAARLTNLFCDQILQDDKRQLLATTHNPLVLDGLDITDDRIRLFAVDRNEAGESRLTRITLTDELQKLSETMPLSRLWVMGRLGGVPKLI